MTTATDDPAFWRAARSGQAGRTTGIDLSATLRPFAEARTLPAEMYVAEDVFRVTGAGELMPQKSTFFAPKLPTGMLFRPLDEPGA